MIETDNISSIQTDRVDELTCSRCRSVLDVSEFEPFAEVDCPACGQKLTIPARLGAFQLLRLLGKGGMGAIYQGVDSALGREVAIKVMLKSLGTDTTLIETFRREARMAAALNHPNVVQIYSCGQEQGQPYIVMELVSGRTMEAIMDHTGPMLDALAIGIGVDVAKGLSAGFDIGLIHGDIKPKNILIDLKGTAKVVDFGLATFVDKHASEQGGIWGTPYYIAPERVLKQPVDARSDIYSLGATLYHAIAGVPPFEGQTPIEVVKARLEGPPKPLSEVRKEVLQKTNSIVMRMLEDKPAKRYPTYLSLLGDLENALQEAEQNAGSPALQAARNAMLKRSSATKTVKHSALSMLSLPREAIAASPAAQAGAQAPKILINLKSRKSRTDLAVPVETEEELAEKKRLQQAAAKRNRFIALTIAAIILVGGLAAAVSVWQFKEGKKRQEIRKVVLRVETVYESLVEPTRKVADETRQASEAIGQVHHRYRTSGNTRAVAIIDEAMDLYATAVAKAGELDSIVTKATEAKNAADQSTSLKFATVNLMTIQALPARAAQLKDEIKKLRRKASELVAQAASEPEQSGQPLQKDATNKPQRKPGEQTEKAAPKPDETSRPPAPTEELRSRSAAS